MPPQNLTCTFVAQPSCYPFPNWMYQRRGNEALAIGAEMAGVKRTEVKGVEVKGVEVEGTVKWTEV